MILPGYGERMYYGYRRAMTVVDSFLVNTIGAEVSRGLRDIGTSTAADTPLPPLEFFGKNLSTAEAIKVASRIDAIFSLSDGTLLGTNGQRNDHADRLMRMTSVSLYATVLVEKLEVPAASGLAFAETLKHAMGETEAAQVHSRFHKLGVLEMEDLARSVYDRLLRSTDPVFSWETTAAADRPFSFAGQVEALIEETMESVDDKAENLSYLATKAASRAAANSTVQAFLSKNVVVKGFQRLEVRGGTFTCMHWCNVVKQVVESAGNDTFELALEQYMEPLSRGKLDKRTIVDTNPLGAKAGSAASIGGAHDDIDEMSEGMPASFRHMAQKEMAHLNYQLRMASASPKER